MTDHDLYAARAVRVYFVTTPPWPECVVKWRRVAHGLEVTALISTGESRTQTIADRDEIDFLLHSGADLMLRDGWRQYTPGRYEGYEDRVFIVDDGVNRTPF